MVNYRRYVLKTIGKKAMKIAFKDMKNYDDYENLSSHHYKMFYLLILRLGKPKNSRDVKDMIFLIYSLIGDHISYFSKHRHFKCIDMICKYNPVFDVYKNLHDIDWL